MVLRKKDYKNMDKFLETRNAQRKRYYQKTQGFKRKKWESKEIETILISDMTDPELSALLSRSVQSIQAMRCKMKKEELYD